MKTKLLKRVRQELRYKFDEQGKCHFIRKSEPTELFTRQSVAKMLQSFYNLQAGECRWWNWVAISNNYREKIIDREWRRK